MKAREAIFQSEFARAIRAYRVMNGVSQAELASLVGMAQANISRLESGEHPVSESTVQQIAKAFGYRSAIVFLSAAKEALHESEHECL